MRCRFIVDNVDRQVAGSGITIRIRHDNGKLWLSLDVLPVICLRIPNVVFIQRILIVDGVRGAVPPHFEAAASAVCDCRMRSIQSYSLATDRDRSDTVSCVGRNRAIRSGLRRSYARASVLKTGFIDRIGNDPDSGRRYRNAVVADIDRQGRGRNITIAVRKRVGENVATCERRAVRALIGVSAIRIQNERTVLADNRQDTVDVRRDMALLVVAGDIRHLGAICAHGIDTRRTFIRARNDIGRDRSLGSEVVGVANCDRAIVLELNLQRHIRDGADGVTVSVSQSSLDVKIGSNLRDVVIRRRIEAGNRIVDRVILSNPDKAIVIDIDLEHRGVAGLAHQCAIGVGGQQDLCMVEGRQAGINAGEPGSILVGDGERPFAIQIRTDLAGEERGEPMGTIADQNAFARLRIADRIGREDRIIGVRTRGRSINVIRAVRIGRRVEPAALVLADRKGLVRRGRDGCGDIAPETVDTERAPFET